MVSQERERISAFVEYAQRLKGDEKGEAQVFCDRLFRAFGHQGYSEAGATLEFRVKRKGKATSYADLRWQDRVLIEMKSRGEKLQVHYSQAFDYWINAVPNRPRYVILCNFDEFWIYDFDYQLHEPVDVVALTDLPKRYSALAFLFPDEQLPPIFGNDRVAVTRQAANKMAEVFQSLIARGCPREEAQRFVLQCVVSMFAEDIDLLPKALFSALVDECCKGASTFDLLGGLFRQMNSPQPAPGGRFAQVPYFNGGLFASPALLELQPNELLALSEANSGDWAKVEPAIFGTLFQASMEAEARHALGAHYTSEAEIQRVVLPTIVRPWEERIRAAKTLAEHLEILDDLLKFRVLDPACGSGNFLYVAYRQLKRLEVNLLAVTHEKFGRGRRRAGGISYVSPRQFYGIDIAPFAVELAKVTLVIAKKLAIDEEHQLLDQRKLDLEIEPALPLDNLDANIVCKDALFEPWPAADAIIGNPPYQSKNKRQEEFGAQYTQRLHKRYPDVPGRADYCVYWFRRAHDELAMQGRAGLVGTNTIRQNYSRKGGLEYIVQNGGTITEAVSTQVWPGEAVVHVSIANWSKGITHKGLKKLFTQEGDSTDSPWRVDELPLIGPSLSAGFDVSEARSLKVNRDSAACFQGQTHGHEGFLIEPEEARRLVASDRMNAQVLFPYLTADDLFGELPPQPTRYAIDFHPRGLLEAQQFPKLFERVKREVLPTRQAAARREEERNAPLLHANKSASVNRHHANFLKRWWLFSYPREEMMGLIARLPRYIVCGQVTKRPIFEFVDPSIHPNAALMVFPLPDDYSFGVLQSSLHWAWFQARCSTLKGDPRYTSDTVFDSFSWPQEPSNKEVTAVASAAKNLRKLRGSLLAFHKLTLRELYRSLDLPGASPLKDAQAELDAAVRGAYGMKSAADPREFLFQLNAELADLEARGKSIRGPGAPNKIAGLISSDAITLKR
jgi:SAM-dependent methyltransferase